MCVISIPIVTGLSTNYSIPMIGPSILLRGANLSKEGVRELHKLLQDILWVLEAATWKSRMMIEGSARHEEECSHLTERCVDGFRAASLQSLSRELLYHLPLFRAHSPVLTSLLKSLFRSRSTVIESEQVMTTSRLRKVMHESRSRMPLS